MSAVVHIVPADAPAGRAFATLERADRRRVRPAAQDAAAEPEGRARRARRAGGARHRPDAARGDASGRGIRRARARAYFSVGGLRAPSAGGRRRSAAGPWRSPRPATSPSGHAVLPHSVLILARFSRARARPRPWRPAPRPARVKRGDVVGLEQQRLAIEPDRLARQLLRARRRWPSSMNAARLRGSTASAVSSRSVAASRLPAAAAARPCASSAIERGSIAVIGALAAAARSRCSAPQS